MMKSVRVGQFLRAIVQAGLFLYVDILDTIIEKETGSPVSTQRLEWKMEKEGNTSRIETYRSR